MIAIVSIIFELLCVWWSRIKMKSKIYFSLYVLVSNAFFIYGAACIFEDDESGWSLMNMAIMTNVIIVFTLVMRAWGKKIDNS